MDAPRSSLLLHEFLYSLPSGIAPFSHSFHLSFGKVSNLTYNFRHYHHDALRSPFITHKLPVIIAMISVCAQRQTEERAQVASIVTAAFHSSSALGSRLAAACACNSQHLRLGAAPVRSNDCETPSKSNAECSAIVCINKIAIPSGQCVQLDAPWPSSAATASTLPTATPARGITRRPVHVSCNFAILLAH